MRQYARFVAALFLVSLALRPQIIGAGPLIPLIQDQLGISHTVAGLLGTIPVLCMGIFAPAAAYVAGAVGVRTTIAGGVALIAVGGLLRVAAPDPVVLVVLTLPVGIGIAVAGSLMPGAVKARLAHRPAFGTGIYATGIQLGAAASAALAVPLGTCTAATGSRSARSRSRRRSRLRPGSSSAAASSASGFAPRNCRFAARQPGPSPSSSP